MDKFSSEGKNAEEILREMEPMAGDGVKHPLFDAMTTAIQVKIVDQLCRTIGAAGGDFIKQSNALRESVEHLKESINDFKKSNERTSKAIIWLTVFIAIAALVEAGTLVFK